MSSGKAFVKLTIDTSGFEAAMRRLAESAARLTTAYRRAVNSHQWRHHAPETPARSAMHAAYDRRRRARRRRR